MVACEVRFATRSGDVSIAYQVTGDGPFDLVLVPGFASHLEFDWEEPRHAAFLERLASFSRLIRLDKRGTGLSDPRRSRRPRDEDGRRPRCHGRRGHRTPRCSGTTRAADVDAVRRHVPGAHALLALFGTYAASWIRDMPEERRNAVIDDVVRRWGDGTSILRFWPDADDVMQAWWGSSRAARRQPRSDPKHHLGGGDHRRHDVLPAIQAPTIVLHSTDDPDVRRRRGTRPGSAHPLGPPGRAAGNEHIALGGRRRAGRRDRGVPHGRTAGAGRRSRPRHDPLHGHRRVDGDGSDARRLGLVTARRAASRGGAEGARSLRGRGDRHRRRRLLRDSTGRRARFAARGIQHALSALGIQIRAGLHTGEVERVRGEKPRGIAVNVAARVSSCRRREVLVTSTIRDLVAGSGLDFEDRGEHELKGLDESRRVYVARGD